MRIAEIVEAEELMGAALDELSRIENSARSADPESYDYKAFRRVREGILASEGLLAWLYGTKLRIGVEEESDADV